METILRETVPCALERSPALMASRPRVALAFKVLEPLDSEVATSLRSLVTRRGPFAPSSQLPSGVREKLAVARPLGPDLGPLPTDPERKGS